MNTVYLKFVRALSMACSLSICFGFVIAYSPVNAQAKSNSTPANLSPDSVDRIIVKFKEKTPKNTRTQIVSSVGSESNHISNPELKLPHEVNIKVNNPSQAVALVKALNNNPNVEYAELDKNLNFDEQKQVDVQAATVTTNDPFNQWHHANIQSPNAWAVSTGLNVLVGVCDTGVQSNHPDLMANIRADLGFNVFTGVASGWNVLENQHGTMVAGTIASVANNSIGGKGVSYGAKIIPIKVSFDSTGGSNVSYLSSCIKYAADKGAKVINVSYNAAGSSSLANAAQYANSKGASVFVAAGNSGNLLNYTNFASIIAVSATNESNLLASFSDYGPYVDFSAPGTNIITTGWNSTYVSTSGTSFASPIAASVAALILQKYPTYTPTQVSAVMRRSVNDLGTFGYDNRFGYGKLNAALAITDLR